MVTMDYNPEYDNAQESYILCADCGTVIPSSNGAGLCKHFSLCRSLGEKADGDRCGMSEEYSGHYRGNPKGSYSEFL